MGEHFSRMAESTADVEMKEPSPEDDELAAMEAELLTMSDDEINQKVKAIKNETKYLGNELARLNHEINSKQEEVKANQDKIKLNKTLPYLVGNIVEILELAPEDGEDEGGNVDLDSQSGEECGAEDIDTTNYLPASDWACRSQGIGARRSGGSQQRQLFGA